MGTGERKLSSALQQAIEYFKLSQAINVNIFEPLSLPELFLRHG
jgi:hypothetical protein